MTVSPAEYVDERHKLPLILTRAYGSWAIRIEEQRTPNNASTGRFLWSLRKDVITPMAGETHAQGVAPTLEMAKDVVERVLLAYAIKIPVEGSETPTVGPGDARPSTRNLADGA